MDRIEVDVIDVGDLPSTPFRPDARNRRSQNIKTVVEVAQTVREVVNKVLLEGDVSLVIGGDCTITLGVVAAAISAMPDTSLAYLDGDVDMSTPETTRSGVLDACAWGICSMSTEQTPRLAGLGPGTPLNAGGKLALIGFEVDDLSEEHEALLEERGVGRFPASDLRDDLAATLVQIDEFLLAGPRIVHFDVDAVYSIEWPLAEFPHFNTGVSVATASEILKHLCATPRLAALVVTEANPRRDPNYVYLPQLARLIADAANARSDAANT